MIQEAAPIKVAQNPTPEDSTQPVQGENPQSPAAATDEVAAINNAPRPNEKDPVSSTTSQKAVPEATKDDQQKAALIDQIFKSINLRKGADIDALKEKLAQGSIESLQDILGKHEENFENQNLNRPNLEKSVDPNNTSEKDEELFEFLTDRDLKSPQAVRERWLGQGKNTVNKDGLIYDAAKAAYYKEIVAEVITPEDTKELKHEVQLKFIQKYFESPKNSSDSTELERFLSQNEAAIKQEVSKKYQELLADRQEKFDEILAKKVKTMNVDDFLKVTLGFDLDGEPSKDIDQDKKSFLDNLIGLGLLAADATQDAIANSSIDIFFQFLMSGHSYNTAFQSREKNPNSIDFKVGDFNDFAIQNGTLFEGYDKIFNALAKEYVALSNGSQQLDPMFENELKNPTTDADSFQKKLKKLLEIFNDYIEKGSMDVINGLFSSLHESKNNELVGANAFTSRHVLSKEFFLHLNQLTLPGYFQSYFASVRR